MEENKQTVKVIIDTSALFIPFYFKIDIFKELEYLIEGKKEYILPAAVLEELEKIPGSKPVREYISRQKFSVVNVPGRSADEAILELVKRLRLRNEQVVVVSGDARLRKLCAELGARVVYVRAKKRLEIE
ncbi:MAG: hypothetical protein GXO42_02860 [bacterium]|nr:hypothetical protein [bacterium]